MEKILKRLFLVSVLTLIIVVIIGVLTFADDNTEQGGLLGGGGLDYVNASSTVYANVAGQAVILAAPNPGRGWMVIQNMTATVANLALNATTSPNSTPILADTKYTIPIAASGSYTFNDDNRYIGRIIASSSAANTFRVTEIY